MLPLLVQVVEGEEGGEDESSSVVLLESGIHHPVQGPVVLRMSSTNSSCNATQIIVFNGAPS